MSIKQIIILFIILLLLPGILGKVSLTPFSNLFTHPSWDAFTGAFTQVFKDDFEFYKGLVMPWIQKILDMFPKQSAPL